MIKKIIITVLFVTSVLSVALAKDGPFPLNMAVGSWRVMSSSMFTVQISSGQRVNDKSIMVSVALKDGAGNVWIMGRTIHDFSDPKLSVIATDIHGLPFMVTLRIEDPAVQKQESQAPGMELLMRIQSAKTGEKFQNYILRR